MAVKLFIDIEMLQLAITVGDIDSVLADLGIDPIYYSLRLEEMTEEQKALLQSNPQLFLDSWIPDVDPEFVVVSKSYSPMDDCVSASIIRPGGGLIALHGDELDLDALEHVDI